MAIKEKLYQGPITVQKSAIQGYGVFATKDLAAGELVEECHTSITSSLEKAWMRYYFTANDQAALVFGYGSIYNHSKTPNVDHEFDSETGLVIFTTNKAIRRGEELFISYGQSWFDERRLKVKSLSLWRRLPRRPLLRASLLFLGILGVTFLFNYF